MRKAVLLNSGGMDSLLLAFELARYGDAVEHVFVDVGQAYRDKEWVAAQRVATAVGATLHSVRGAELARHEHATGIIPFRNLEMILNAAVYGDDIYMGVLADEVNSDKSTIFMRAAEEVLNISHRRQYWTEGRTFSIKTPLRNSTKTDALRRYFNEGGFLPLVMQTVSCYDGGDRHCGRCASCFKRWVALVNNDVDVTGHFNQHPATWQTFEQLALKMRDYPRRRVEEILGAYRKAGLEQQLMDGVRALAAKGEHGG